MARSRCCGENPAVRLDHARQLLRFTRRVNSHNRITAGISKRQTMARCDAECHTGIAHGRRFDGDLRHVQSIRGRRRQRICKGVSVIPFPTTDIKNRGRRRVEAHGKLFNDGITQRLIVSGIEKCTPCLHHLRTVTRIARALCCTGSKLTYPSFATSN